MGTEKWDYKPDTFASVDTTKDGLLNSTELTNYFQKLYTDTNTQSNYQSTSDYLARADINGDGLISKGEIALYKSGQDYLDQSTFVDKVATTTETDATKANDAKNAQWNDLQKEYNIYDSKEIISKGEIMAHDQELHRTAVSYNSATFNSADADKNGFLDRSDMKTYLTNFYGTCSDKQIDYTLSTLDINKDGLVSDGEFAFFKLNNESSITADKLVNAGFSKSDADALVKKYAPEGKQAFNADDIKNTDDRLQGKPVDNTKDGISVGGIIALVSCCLIVVGLVAWGIWWLSKDDKKKETTTETKDTNNSPSDSNLETVNAKGKTIIIQ